MWSVSMYTAANESFQHLCSPHSMVNCDKSFGKYHSVAFKATLLMASAHKQAWKKSTWQRACQSLCPVWIRASLCLQVQSEQCCEWNTVRPLCPSVWHWIPALTPTPRLQDYTAGRRAGRRGNARRMKDSSPAFILLYIILQGLSVCCMHFQAVQSLTHLTTGCL